MPDRSCAVIVVGMHRSGTSVVMAALEALGVATGEHLLPPGPDNQGGYWEDKAIVDLNNRLLAALGKTWSSVAPIAKTDWLRSEVDTLKHEAVALLKAHFVDFGLWGFKDPRVARVLPFWQEVIGEVGAAVKYVIAIRNPESVAASLAYRNHFSCAKSYFMWLAHYLPFLDDLLREDRLIVSYDQLVDDAPGSIRKLGQFVHDSDWNLRDSVEENVDAFLASTLRSSLRHTRFDISELNSAGPPVLRDAFVLLDRLTDPAATASTTREVRALRARYAEYASLLQDVDALEAEALRLRTIVGNEEPIRDKIEKMGLNLADIQSKAERVDARHEVQAAQAAGWASGLGTISADVARLTSGQQAESRQGQLLAQNLELLSRRIDLLDKGMLDAVNGSAGKLESVTASLHELHESARSDSKTIEVLESRIEDIQEKVVVQIDELHRMIANILNPREPVAVRVSELPSDLAAAHAQIQAIYGSTSWRITKPVRAIKSWMIKAAAIVRR